MKKKRAYVCSMKKAGCYKSSFNGYCNNNDPDVDLGFCPMDNDFDAPPTIVPPEWWERFNEKTK